MKNYEKKIEIKECPICGMSPILDADSYEQGQRFRFVCKECGLHSDDCNSYEEAASNWNWMLATNSDKITKQKRMEHIIGAVVDVISMDILLMCLVHLLMY